MNDRQLYRGFKNTFVPGEHLNKYLKVPRKPLDTPIMIHLAADEWFNSKFGYKFRSEALFCTGVMGIAHCYGSVGIIEPIGKHLFCWSSEVEDFTGNFLTETNLVNLLESSGYQTFTYDNKALLRDAMESKCEIMLWCEKYSVTNPVT